MTGRGAVRSAPLRSADVRRLEVVAGQLCLAMQGFLRQHEEQVDRLSQRMQVVVAEVGCLKAALEAAQGRMNDVPRELGRAMEPRGRRST